MEQFRRTVIYSTISFPNSSFSNYIQEGALTKGNNKKGYTRLNLDVFIFRIASARNPTLTVVPD